MLLKLGAGVKIGAANNDKTVEHVAVLPTLLFFIGLAIPKSIFILNCLNSVTELSLIGADKVQGGLDMVKLN
jgi:hypothetical protein